MKQSVNLQKQDIFESNTGMLLLLIAVAYLFSIAVRMYWPLFFMDNDSLRHAGELMINTNDGYFFASGARDIIEGIAQADKQKASAFDVSGGLVLLSAYAVKWTPLSLETVILYLPAVISSLIVLPIILTGRLMRHTLLGFFAALLGSVAWSYYNRTMVGYYDTDMFSVLLQFSIFYAFMHIVYKKDFASILLASFLIFIYPYFYPQGMTIVYAMFMMLVVYLLFEYQEWISQKDTADFHDGALSLYGSIILLSIVLMDALPMIIRITLFFVALLFLLRIKSDEKKLLYIALVFFIGFLFFGNIFATIMGKVFSFLDRGVESEGLKFYQVIQTVREAGTIPFSVMANRISGSQLGVLLSLVGYVVLVLRHKPFIIALPMIGVGVLSLWAGLRFTVYAVPIAALSAVYLFYVISTYLFKEKKQQYLVVGLATFAMLYPNITHIIGYKVPTVLRKAEVQDLEKLKSIATPKDYTITWWDYGYPVWFYSNTNTLIDGGKHTKDNFLVSTILQTTSPQLAANLSRLAIETYVDSNYSIVADTLFRNRQKDQLDPNLLLSELEDNTYPLPSKTRDIYLYLPYRMLNIFPTVMVFGNLNLQTGKKVRNTVFYPTQAVSQKGNMIILSNGIVFDAQKGELEIGGQKRAVKEFIVTQNDKSNQIVLQSQAYHADGEFVIIYMKSYGRFLILDRETFKSMYIQMFVLGKYDKKLFDLVVASPYSRIYKLKI